MQQIQQHCHSCHVALMPQALFCSQCGEKVAFGGVNTTPEDAQRRPLSPAPKNRISVADALLLGGAALFCVWLGLSWYIRAVIGEAASNSGDQNSARSLKTMDDNVAAAKSALATYSDANRKVSEAFSDFGAQFKTRDMYGENGRRNLKQITDTFEDSVEAVESEVAHVQPGLPLLPQTQAQLKKAHDDLEARLNAEHIVLRAAHKLLDDDSSDPGFSEQTGYEIVRLSVSVGADIERAYRALGYSVYDLDETGLDTVTLKPGAKVLHPPQ